jgi:hypothetical protein
MPRLHLPLDGPRLRSHGTRKSCCAPRWSHYNLYSSNHPGFACDRSTIIASPDAPEYVDWRAPAGPNYYKVTQVTLDGLESAPSNEMAVAR